MAYAIFDSDLRQIRLYDNADNLLESSDVDSLPVADDAIHSATVSLHGGVITASMDGVCIFANTNDEDDPYVYLGSDAGTVKFATFTFTKHKDFSEPKDSRCLRPHCPQTPVPCDCCDPDPAGSYVIDLYGGGWTSMTCFDCADPVATCIGCDSVVGEYVVDANGSCGWVYEQGFLCVDDPTDYQWGDLCLDTLLCSANNNPAFTLYLYLTLVPDGPDGACRWKVVVSVSVTVVNPVTCGGEQCIDGTSVPLVASNVVTYYSDYLAARDRCNSMPVQLSKYSETGDYPCRGTLPSTITLGAA